jgi:uncharacterized membrane protein (UPF0127 family)
MIRLRISNLTKNSILATHAQVANTPEARLRGLIGMTEPEFQPGAGLLFPEVNAIHTVQMSMLIDVLFIDMTKRRVQKAVQNAEPGCHFNVLIPAPICAVLELPAGVIEMTGTQPGDVLVIMSAGHASGEELGEVSSLWPTGA